MTTHTLFYPHSSVSQSSVEYEVYSTYAQVRVRLEYQLQLCRRPSTVLKSALNVFRSMLAVEILSTSLSCLEMQCASTIPFRD